MSDLVNTTKNTALKAAGRVKQAAGAVTGNRDLQARGEADEITANLRQAGNRLTGAVKSLTKVFTG